MSLLLMFSISDGRGTREWLKESENVVDNAVYDKSPRSLKQRALDDIAP